MNANSRDLIKQCNLLLKKYCTRLVEALSEKTKNVMPPFEKSLEVSITRIKVGEKIPSLNKVIISLKAFIHAEVRNEKTLKMFWPLCHKY